MQKGSKKPKEADDPAHSDSQEQFFRSLTLFLVVGLNSALIREYIIVQFAR